MALTLIASSHPPPPEYGPAPFDLATHPLRPGLAHEPLQIHLERGLRRAVADHAHRDGLSAPAWAVIVIESQRALTLAAEISPHTAAELERRLHAVAAPSTYTTLPRGPGSRLAAYARQLRATPQAGTPRDHLAADPLLPVPYNLLTAWRQIARAEHRTPAEWAAAKLANLPAGRVEWEAAAAETGATLGEWVLLHAASR